MPLLLPDQQFFLIKLPINSDKYVHGFERKFFMYYLSIANKTFNKNAFYFKIHNNFKNKLFQLESMPLDLVTEKNIQNTNINNYYSFLLSLNKAYYSNMHYVFQKGYYCKFQFQLSNLNFFFFSFQLEYNWILTDSSFIILSIKSPFKSEILPIINMEIDLLNASGFLVVLCFLCNEKCDENFLDSIFEIIKSNHFAEIHFNYVSLFEYGVSNKENQIKFDTVLQKIIDLYESEFYSYFYLYSTYNESTKPQVIELQTKLKNNPLFESIVYSVPLKVAFPKKFPDGFFKRNEYGDSEDSFVLCKYGYICPSVKIQLCNVPLYSSDDETNDFTPVGISGCCSGFIQSNEFFFNNFKRVKVYFDDNTHKYVELEDIHKIKPELYVENTLYLTPTDNDTIDIINKIYESWDTMKDNASNLSLMFKDIEGCLKYISYQLFKSKKIRLHQNQLFTAFVAAKSLISGKSKTLKRGNVYQVETGEGKSYIIQVLALLLALKGKTVHIATSNIVLSFDDFRKSKKFFESFGQASSLLVHYDEIQQITSQKELLTEEDRELLFNDPCFSKESFHNSSHMNVSVCGINNNNEILKKKTNIIFSTFTNFEGFYLRLMELFPAYISKYFNDCCLIIDEADAILLDEITNGTILSRPMRSNASKVLMFVYKSHLEGKDEKFIEKEIKKKWPKCKDISTSDILKMFHEIDLVNSPDFANGKKYSVETAKPDDIRASNWNFDDDEDKKNIVDKFKEKISPITDKIELVKTKIDDSLDKIVNSANKKFEHQMKKANFGFLIINEEEEEEEEEDNIDEQKYQKKVIIPFDYENKGILEPNKEFNGFVHQFVAIKEKLNNDEYKNIIIKNISMNYLYVSHPIFVSLYPCVCGFTGTIGNKYDKKVFNEQYNMDTFIIPRNLPNQRVDLPLIICKDTIERNNKIVKEVYSYNKLNYPILIVCKDSNDIKMISILLKQINIIPYLIEGKTFEERPQDFAGKNGSVTIGTNLCGRGTDIKIFDKPLHVIVAYYSSNIRVIQQAFGRTGRQGMKGTARIICTEQQYITSTNIVDCDSMKSILSDFECKNDLQTKFIYKFKESRKWIFDNEITKQDISKYIKQIRETKINVNRIVAYKYEFPICMSIDTFLDIQAQKIFSLYNCPNCKYTWMLFQRYVREMILESWSLFIDRSEEKFSQQTKYKSYSDYLDHGSRKLYNKLLEYLPIKSAKTDIVSTFMHIFNKVIEKWQPMILQQLSNESMYYVKQKSFKFCSFNFGFFPFELHDKSGARINTLKNPENEPEYIYDPELRYLQKLPDGAGFTITSITQKIDNLFNFICKKINKAVGGFIGLKFFLRRTLGGCEFGICLDLDLQISNQNFENCLIDKKPLLLFSISLRSLVPLLAGILIIFLVYIARISGKIVETIINLPEIAAKKITEITIVQILEHTAKEAISNLAENMVSKLCDILFDILTKQIKSISKFDTKLGMFLQSIANIFNVKDWSNASESISDILGSVIKINCSFADFISDCIPKESLLKLGLFLILCIASFMFNFYFHKSIKYNNEKKAQEFQTQQNPNLALKENDKLVKTVF